MKNQLYFKKLFIVVLFCLTTRFYVSGQPGKKGDFSTTGFFL